MGEHTDYSDKENKKGFNERSRMETPLPDQWPRIRTIDDNIEDRAETADTAVSAETTAKEQQRKKALKEKRLKQRKRRRRMLLVRLAILGSLILCILTIAVVQFVRKISSKEVIVTIAQDNAEEYIEAIREKASSVQKTNTVVSKVSVTSEKELIEISVEEMQDTEEDILIRFSDIDTIYLSENLSADQLFHVQNAENYEVVYNTVPDLTEEGEQLAEVLITDADGESFYYAKTFQVVEDRYEYLAVYDFDSITAEEIILSYISEHGLDADHFSFFYYNSESKERYLYNENTLFAAASTIKVPLSLVYYDMAAVDKISLEDTITLEYAHGSEGGGTTSYNYEYGSAVEISYLLEKSIQDSDNVAANMLLAGLGGAQAARYEMLAYTDRDMTDEFIRSSQTNAAYGLDVLSYLYKNSASYEKLIADMKAAAAGQYLQKGIADYEVAHKYGNYDACYHDYGIVYTPTPFLIGIFTREVGSAEEMIAELGAVFTEYTVYQSEH